VGRACLLLIISLPSVGRAGLEPAYSLLIRQEPLPIWPPASGSESQHRTDDLRLMKPALWPTELSRRGWPPRDRTAQYLRIRQARRPAGSRPADGGGPDPQRASTRPSRFKRAPTARPVHHPERRAEVTISSDNAHRFSKPGLRPGRFTLHGGRRRTRISGPPDPHPLSRRGPPPGDFISQERKAEQSKLTVLPAHRLAGEPGTLSGSPSVPPAGLEPAHPAV
jgi:hypothetical protein